MSVRVSRLALAQTFTAFAEAVRCPSDFLTYLFPGLCKSIHMNRNLLGAPCPLVLAQVLLCLVTVSPP